MFECCVDIGYEAQDTPGNADETMHWAADQGFSKLIIVTSSYHMPRSLTELGRVMPDVRLVPYPVGRAGLPQGALVARFRARRASCCRST